jgi:hypothetical protein
MSLSEHFFTGLSLYLEARIWIRIRIRVKVGSGSASSLNKNTDPHQGDKSNSEPHQCDADPQHCEIVKKKIMSNVMFISRCPTSFVSVDIRIKIPVSHVNVVREAAVPPAHTKPKDHMTRV